MFPNIINNIPVFYFFIINPPFQQISIFLIHIIPQTHLSCQNYPLDNFAGTGSYTNPTYQPKNEVFSVYAIFPKLYAHTGVKSPGCENNTTHLPL